MAFGQGRDNAAGGGGIKRFVGVGTVKVLAFNPTMEEWNKITGGNLQKEPEYTSVSADGIKQARITLLVQPDPAKTMDGSNPVIPINFFLKKLPIKGTNSGKYQIIDIYGRTAWATEDDIKEKKIPVYSNGPADIDADYRRIVSGEGPITDFAKALLVIPAYRYKDRKTGAIITNPNPSECEARLNNILAVFEGDFSEIKKIIMEYQPNNMVKVLFGVKTTPEGKEYQDVFMDCFLSANNPSNLAFAKKLAELQRGGIHTYDNTYFGDYNPDGTLITNDLRERVVTPTEFTEKEGGEAPAPAVAPVAAPAEEDSDLPF